MDEYFEKMTKKLNEASGVVDEKTTSEEYNIWDCIRDTDGYTRSELYLTLGAKEVERLDEIFYAEGLDKAIEYYDEISDGDNRRRKMLLRIAGMH